MLHVDLGDFMPSSFLGHLLAEQFLYLSGEFCS